MPILNPDKSYVNASTIKLTEGIVIPEDWLTKLGNLVADDILKLPAQERTIFLDKLKEKAGSASTYTLKPQLLESLKVIYGTLSAQPPCQQKNNGGREITRRRAALYARFYMTAPMRLSLAFPHLNLDVLQVYRQASWPGRKPDDRSIHSQSFLCGGTQCRLWCTAIKS